MNKGVKSAKPAIINPLVLDEFLKDQESAMPYRLNTYLKEPEYIPISEWYTIEVKDVTGSASSRAMFSTQPPQTEVVYFTKTSGGSVTISNLAGITLSDILAAAKGQIGQTTFFPQNFVIIESVKEDFEEGMMTTASWRTRKMTVEQKMKEE